MRVDRIIVDGGFAGESEFYCTVLIKARGGGTPGVGGSLCILESESVRVWPSRKASKCEKGSK